jgi:parvulin-like peptidyl-prolyl isomerase
MFPRAVSGVRMHPPPARDERQWETIQGNRLTDPASGWHTLRASSRPRCEMKPEERNMRARRWQIEAGLSGVIGVLAVILGLAGCGGSGSADHAKRAGTPSGRQVSVASEEPSGLASPGAVVARVGPYPITGALFDRYAEAQLNGPSSSEQLSPPEFSSCVGGLQAQAASLGEHAAGVSQLRKECKERYQELLQAALEHAISDEWLIGGARELGVPLGGSATLETKAKRAVNAIRGAIRDRAESVTHAQIASYYARNRFEYLAAGSRDLEIARTKTKDEAAKVKAEIASGESFASVVRKLPVGQPIDSGKGLVLGLQPHYYGEPNLNQAIFTATPGVLVGPVNTWFGYFVFKVTKIDSEHMTPLADVEATIRKDLVEPRETQALAAFNKRWSVTWTAETDCSPGYVVPKCRQFTGTPLAPPDANPPLG